MKRGSFSQRSIEFQPLSLPSEIFFHVKVKELTGCDLLTISPKLLAELDVDKEVLTPKLDALAAKKADIKKISMDEKTFR